MQRYILYLILSLALIHALSNVAYGMWIQKASFGGDARHRCTGFSIGNKGYIGGGHTNSGTLAYFKDYWEYDPGTNSWTQIADYGGGYRYHSTAFTIGNYAYVGLGENDNSEYCNDFWKYIPLINTWVQVAAFPGEPRRGACAFMIDDIGYCGTGQTETGYALDFYAYNPMDNTWTQITDFSGEARSSAVAFAHDGKGYVGTGHVFGDDRADFFEYDPTSNTWTQKADVGVTPRQDATGFVLHGEAYIGTGNNTEGTENFDDFWKYNFTSDSWIQIADFDGQARRYMVSFTIGDIAYCGTGTTGTNLRDFWAFIPLLSNSELKHDNPLAVYPNPCTTHFFISGIQSESYPLQLAMYDLNGRLVENKNLPNENASVAVDNVKEGNYIIVVTTNQNQITVGYLSIIP